LKVITINLFNVFGRKEVNTFIRNSHRVPNSECMSHWRCGERSCAACRRSFSVPSLETTQRIAPLLQRCPRNLALTSRNFCLAGWYGSAMPGSSQEWRRDIIVLWFRQREVTRLEKVFAPLFSATVLGRPCTLEAMHHHQSS